jgi:hypothetical protein
VESIGVVSWNLVWTESCCLSSVSSPEIVLAVRKKSTLSFLPSAYQAQPITQLPAGLFGGWSCFVLALIEKGRLVSHFNLFLNQYLPHFETDVYRMWVMIWMLWFWKWNRASRHAGQMLCHWATSSTQVIIKFCLQGESFTRQCVGCVVVIVGRSACMPVWHICARTQILVWEEPKDRIFLSDICN